MAYIIHSCTRSRTEKKKRVSTKSLLYVLSGSIDLALINSSRKWRVLYLKKRERNATFESRKVFACESRVGAIIVSSPMPIVYFMTYDVRKIVLDSTQLSSCQLHKDFTRAINVLKKLNSC